MEKIRIYGDLNYGTGYNVALRGLVQCLEELGWSSETVHVVGASTSTYYREFETSDWLTPYVYGEWWGDDTVNIVVLNPGLVRAYHTSAGGRKNIAYSSWETDRLPRIVVDGKTVVDDLNTFDEVWVPSEHVKRVFEESGVKVPIFVISHVLLRGMSKFYDAPPVSSEVSRFYTIGSWNARKNVEQLLRAYFAVGWTAESPVKLTLHVVPATRDSHAVGAAGWVAQEAAKNLYQSASSPLVLPPFGLLCTPRSFDEMYTFHVDNQIFATASCGEGFCIPIYEALALGNVVVASGPWAEDLLKKLPLDQRQFIVPASRKAPVTPMPECRGYELDHEWWVPEQQALVAALHSAPDRRADKRVVDFVREQYSVKTVSNLIGGRFHVLGVE